MTHYYAQVYCAIFLFGLFSVSSLNASTIPITSGSINAVQETITGVVLDENGESIIGAEVLIKGSARGTVSDVEGRFSILANKGEFLRVLFIGYQEKEVLVTDSKQYSIVLKEGASALSEVVIIGSRSKPRTDVNRVVPVDIIKAKDLITTGQTDLGQMIQFSSPSFNSAKYGVNGTTNYAEPSTLRGMSPDQSLVLINGKRRHQFSALNLNVAPGLGTIVTDLNSIPTLAVKQLEVLRDGGAAQYGSDAISGIINLSLQDKNDGGTYQSLMGVHKEGDGVTIKNALNYGFDLGKENSFFNFTLETFSFNGTNRSDPYTGDLYPEAPADYATTGPTEDYPYFTTDPRSERGIYPADGDFVVGNYGSNENETYQAFANTSYPITEQLDLYAFGGASQKNIKAYAFFRNPSNYSRAVLEVFPDGYVPEVPGISVDYSTVVGLKRKSSSGWNIDFSYGIGYNRLDLWANNTTNPSMGSSTPTEFKVGQFEFTQNIVESNWSKGLGSVLGMEDVHIAFGGQYRIDRFQLQAGSPESYEVGPLAVLGKDVGSSSRPGISDEDKNDLNRSNAGIYADLEADITKKLLLALALRYENYSDFGGNLSGKLAARYKIDDHIGVRASYNRGFRAPSLAQIGNSVSTSTGQNGVIVITKQVASSDERLTQLGVEDPKAEISDNFNLGFMGSFWKGSLLFTVDVFQINIQDRIVISERLSTSLYPSVASLFSEAKEIRFFTNHIDTKTRGIETVLTYKKRVDPKSSLNVSGAFTFNQTRVVSQKETPSQITEGASSDDQNIQLLGKTAIELIEVAQPRLKFLASANYQYGKWGINTRITRFGNVKAYSSGLSDEDANVECDTDGRCVQTFAAKTITDLSLSYNFSPSFTFTVGSNNVFDVYPDKYNNTADGFAGEAGSYQNGQIPYSRNSNQFGFNGAYYYVMGVINF